MLWTAVLAASVVIRTVMSDGGVVVKWRMKRKRMTRNKGHDDEQDAEDGPRSSLCERVCKLSTLMFCTPPSVQSRAPVSISETCQSPD